ncbi:MAG: CBS domain-containing protein [Actinobacteria bacterium]|nr:CBS domain-containing protein [Actinomycetota bacterium]MCG2819661.1 CBS domain-containing protein [Actinomycetes bacterium]MBU4179253.1 CBS domain-containing protein [Actinomycetota bacterium]MBU4217373.1 CBS domain-containing protein [Actinomycetota bacterium]MBU4359935.1 CBS domain-containing protein [Actinomycetota bacterium]
MKSLQVEQAMTADPITVSAETSVTDVARIMVDNGIGGVPVVDDSGEILGIVTESDLIVHDSDVEFPSFVHFLTGYVFVPGSLHRFEEKFRRAVANTAGQVMTEDPMTVEADDPVEDVATIMSKKKMKRFPVMREGKLVGIITMADIVRLISEDIPVESPDY